MLSINYKKFVMSINNINIIGIVALLIIFALFNRQKNEEKPQTRSYTYDP